MKRISLFLTDGQLRQAKTLGKKIDAPIASVLRHAIDYYFKALKEGGITPKLLDGRVARSRLNTSRPQLKRTNSAARS